MVVKRSGSNLDRDEKEAQQSVNNLISSTNAITVGNISNYLKDRPLVAQMVWDWLQNKRLERGSSLKEIRKLAPCQNKFQYNVCPL